MRQPIRGHTLDALAKLPEIKTAINIWLDATIASSDGDDRGIAVADHIDRKDSVTSRPQSRADRYRCNRFAYSQLKISAVLGATCFAEAMISARSSLVGNK